MGDTSMDPMCANIDGKPNNWIKHEKQKGNYATIKITQNEYYFEKGKDGKEKGKGEINICSLKVD